MSETKYAFYICAMLGLVCCVYMYMNTLYNAYSKLNMFVRMKECHLSLVCGLSVEIRSWYVRKNISVAVGISFQWFLLFGSVCKSASAYNSGDQTIWTMQTNGHRLLSCCLYFLCLVIKFGKFFTCRAYK